MNATIVYNPTFRKLELNCVKNQFTEVQMIEEVFQTLVRRPLNRKVLIIRNKLSFGELQKFRKLKNQFPYVELVLNPTEKLTIRENIEYVDAGFSVDSSKTKDKVVQSKLRDRVLRLDPAVNTVYGFGEKLILRQKEFELLEFLIINQGRLLTKELILSAVWEYNDFANSRTVEVHMSRLRAKLTKQFKRKLIKTVHRQGFIFEILR